MVPFSNHGVAPTCREVDYPACLVGRMSHALFPERAVFGLAASETTAHPFLLCPGSVQSLLKRVSLVLSQFFALREIVQQLFVGRL